MKSVMRSSIALLLAIITLLTAACAGGGGEAVTTTPDTEGASLGDATVPEDTLAPVETEAEAEPPVEVVIPEENVPYLGEILQGDSVTLTEKHTFVNTSLGSLKTEGTFVSTGGSLFKESDIGLIAANTGWDALGFAAPVSTDTYSVEAEFYVYENDRGGAFNAAMVGLFCKTAENLFIDGGLWFSFRERQVAVYVKQGFEEVIDSNLPFHAADGIRFKAEGNRENVRVYANDMLIATVSMTESDTLTVSDAEGVLVAETGLEHLSVDGNGYFRYMSHYAHSALVSMSLDGLTQRAYSPDGRVCAFLSDTSYAFVDKAQYLADVPTAVYGGLCYADGEMLGKMFGFSAVVDGDTLTMVRDDVTLVFTAGKAEVRVNCEKNPLNGEAQPFPTAVKRGDSLLLPVASFGEMLGYTDAEAEGLTILAAEHTLTQEAIMMAQERFDLYKEVIYNYEDVECDQTGVGKYDPTDPSERLVGIAYSTWHTSARPWGSGTWDLPLYGTYCSDDEEVIRRHGEMLRDAGIDFVFVDWSNNTEYDPATMREHRADFRMIEEATDLLFDVWATIEGAPKICIFVGPGHNGPATITNGAHQKKVDQVWEDYVTNPARADMYFRYEGKPLLICYGATPTMYGVNPTTQWDDDRYTVRWMTGYVGQQPALFHERTLASKYYWSWEERGAQTFAVNGRSVEAVTVTAATRAQGAESTTGYIPEAGRQNGATFKKQFQRACDLGAKFALIVSWNEWTTGEQPSAEVSKDIEPSVVYGTFYYDLMREQIKKFKGLAE